jgi:hypothetical protein
MVRLPIGVAALLLLLGCGSVALAQDTPVPKHASHKAHAKKVESSDSDFSENWDIAAPKSSSGKPADVNEDPNVAAGRKKFFERSDTMEGGGPAGAHSGATSGFTPSMGLSF